MALFWLQSCFLSDVSSFNGGFNETVFCLSYRKKYPNFVFLAVIFTMADYLHAHLQYALPTAPPNIYSFRPACESVLISDNAVVHVRLHCFMLLAMSSFTDTDTALLFTICQ